MKMNPEIFREYDIRGIAGKDYDDAFVEALGRAYGTYLQRNGITRAAVGRDCRLSGPTYHRIMKSALRSTGVDVIDIGECPTPLMYFTVFHLDLMGGIQVTGSHNPADHNGFKICKGKWTIHGDEIMELSRIIESGDMMRGDGTEESYPIIPAYQGYLEEQFGRCGEGVKVVVDSGNGTAGPVAPAVYRAMGCQVVELFSEPDGSFPNHHPDPTVEENVRDLVAAVLDEKADLGIAFDGDSDRIGLVDSEGRIIWGDEMLVVFARDILEANPGATVVSEVKCSQRLYDDIADRGGKGIMWKAGHSLLKAKMRETGALLGGEMSGHLFFADRYFGFDDAIYAGARMIEILARSRVPLSEALSDLPHAVYTPEIRLDCPDAIKFKLADRARDRFREKGCDIIDVDGVRVRFENGWGLVRASNTQPVLVLRFEADNEENLSAYRSFVEDELSALRAELEDA
ncbi:MAG TPA: phosphomannomutase/phosphoglucomutase [Deltaproteobacteria bacterium]|nr:phosphomannomutase/phosphoglucomutase [Candidatus Binatota bacterium]HIL12113.1 phosphomannomutase/phosphoglucomutase [Deltaproteobacteria bacterium]